MIARGRGRRLTGGARGPARQRLREESAGWTPGGLTAAWLGQIRPSWAVCLFFFVLLIFLFLFLLFPFVFDCFLFISFCKFF